MIIWLGHWTCLYLNCLEILACQPQNIDYVCSNAIKTVVRYHVPVPWTSDNLKQLNKWTSNNLKQLNEEQHAQGNCRLIR